MLITWLLTAIVTFTVAILFNRLFPTDYGWFMRLRRPAWLTFERAIPVIWISIFVCGITSASLVWLQAPATGETWLRMLGYLVVELAILAYMPLLCGLRSLRAGAIAGASGWILGCLLCLWIWPVSRTAGLLILPYLLWSPVGTYVTWDMIRLNPTEA